MTSILRCRGGLAAAGVAATAGLFGHYAAYCDERSSANQMLTYGLNVIGQLGIGHDRPMAKPEKVSDLDGVSLESIALGDNATAAITDEGTLYTWGSGAYGRLGHGDESSLNLPRRNEHLNGRRIVQVALGGFHALALDDQGSVYSWGRSVAAGQDSLDNVYIPSQVRGELENVKVKAVAAGRLHCAAVGEDGSVYTWGNNMEGELGQGDKRNRTVPKRVQGLHDKRAVSVACGRDFTLVLLDDGTLYSFGADDYGQLGLGRGHDQRYVTVPRRVVGGLAEVKEVVAGDYHSCAVTQSGAVFTWGIGREGQLGHGEKSDQAIPKKVDGLDGVEVEQVCCGGGHSGAISSSGELYLWGRGRDGQLGREGELESIAAYRLVPTRVESLRNFSVIQAGLGSDHSAVLAKMKH